MIGWANLHVKLPWKNYFKKPECWLRQLAIVLLKFKILSKALRLYEMFHGRSFLTSELIADPKTQEVIKYTIKLRSETGGFIKIW